MNCAEVSDLEEGEILEYDSVSSNYSKGDFGAKNWCTESSLKENRNGHFEFKGNKELCLPERRKDGYINLKLKEKLNLNEIPREEKSNIIMADLESISSEGECKSDEEDKYPASESEYYGCANEETKKREKHSPPFYGTVEDIMSEIGETICRKSRCNYKKRKSKEVKQNLEKCSNRTYGLWRREIFSSHLKSKKHKRKGSFCDSDSDPGKHRTEKRKKRKKREVYYDEEETPAKKLKLRDFDEVRRNLLEKLKKQKAEEEPKESTPLETENSDIQEIDMLIDCTNYVDNPPEGSAGGGGGREVEENEGEDELDLIKLRSIALASNKKRKVEEATTNAEGAPDFSEEKKPECSKEEVDLDRNELLLRAEALKTALLKKHQRRLNRMKVEKPEETGSSSINDGENSSSPPPAGETLKCGDLEKENATLDSDTCKENVESGAAGCSNVHGPNHLELEKNKGNNTAFASNGSTKKTHSRAKTKRKKRKSVSFGNNLKENNEKSEALEEDDRTLRTQLLSDLMKKKSLKDMEKKSVLMDSVQTGANKPSPSPSPSLANAEPPKEAAKPLPGPKKNLLKKVNAPKTVKPAVVAAKFPKPEIQRIIVHLGSEDSSDEDVAAAAAVPRPPPPQEKAEGKGSAITGSTDASKEAGEVIQAKYERSVELLLSQARKKIEGEKRIATKTLATPEAVYKHLPPSQRLEYIRLKQKIAEREKLRKRQMENTSNSVPASSAPQPVQGSAANGEESFKTVSQKPTSGNVAKTNSSQENGSHKNTSSASKPQTVRNSSSNSKNVRGSPISVNETKPKETTQRLVVNRMKNTLTGSSGNNSNGGSGPPEKEVKSAILLPSSQALITKLKLLLKKIKIEKMIEENYEKEISKLKNQLSLFEKKKCEQRFKIKKIWEESMKTYKAIQGITGKSKEKESAKGSEQREDKKKTETDGRSTADEGKKPEKGETKEADDQEEGKKVSDEPETEITQSKSDKELNDDKISETVAEEGTSSTSQAGLCPMKYDSPLQVFNKVSDGSTRVDPNVMVCQFDLMGVCKDEECTYQHLRMVAK